MVILTTIDFLLVTTTVAVSFIMFIIEVLCSDCFKSDLYKT